MNVLKLKIPDVIILSSVLPYVKNPYELLEKIMEYKFKNLIVDRTPFLQGNDCNDLLTIQKVPKTIYEANYPAWILDKTKFLNFIQKDYLLITEFLGADGIIKIGKIPAPYKGFIFEHKKK